MSPFATVESMDTWSKMPFDLKTIYIDNYIYVELLMTKKI